MPKNVTPKLRGNAALEQVNAKKNIKTKMKILEDWSINGAPLMIDGNGDEIRNKKGDLQLDWYPKSWSAACPWDGSKNCEGTQKLLDKQYGGISGTSRDTLRDKYPEEKEIIEGLIETIKLKVKQQEAKLNKGTIIDDLQAENKMLKKALEVVEIRYRQVQQRTKEITGQLNEEKTAHASSRKMWGYEVEEIENEVRALTLENQSLTQALAKVKKIGVVKK